MTPKEKAIKLVQKYYVEVLYGNLSDYSEKLLRVFTIKAKTCALIAVDEILNVACPDTFACKYYDGEFYSDQDYFKEVRKEIEKL
jgi:hypothetical protein